MSREEAFKFFDGLFVERSMTYLSRFSAYRILMDLHGVSRKEASDHWFAYEQSENYQRMLQIIDPL